VAYTSSPEKQTYSSPKVPLVHDFKLQPGAVTFGAGNINVLSGVENVIPLKAGDSLSGITRPGLTFTSLSTTANMVCRGLYVWEKFAGVTTYYFMVLSDGANTYIYSSANGTSWANIHNWAITSVNPCRFTEFITSTNTKYLILLTGDRGYVFTSNAAGTQITDADFPANHRPFPVFLNGRLYVAKQNTGDIYNSALDDPLSWAAGDFISSEVYPDDIQALAKVNNYLVAIGASGIEYFYDAANATASPLARQEGGLLPFGTVFPYTVAESKGGFTFLARNNDGGISLKVVEGFQVKDISTEAVSTLITKYLTNNSTNSTRMLGNYLRMYGNPYYMLTFDGTLSVGASVAANSYLATMVYSFDAGAWCKFSYPDTNHADQFPVTFVAQSNSTSGQMYVAGTTYSAVFYGSLAETSQNDNGNPIQQTLNLPPQNFGTSNRKFMSRAGIRVLTPVPATTINFSYTDTPGNSSYTSGGSFGNLTDFPFITQLGTFRDRQMKVDTTTPTAAINWNYLEIDINKGQQ
jgi:hypothetical protein